MAANDKPKAQSEPGEMEIPRRVVFHGVWRPSIRSIITIKHLPYAGRVLNWLILFGDGH